MDRDRKILDQVIFPGGVPSKTVKEQRSAPEPDPSHVEVNRWDLRPRKMMFRGEEVSFYPIGALAAALHRKPVTIRSWEDKGILPKSRYRLPAPKSSNIPGKTALGRRIYTRGQIEAVIEAAGKYNILYPTDKPSPEDWKHFTAAVVRAWQQETHTNNTQDRTNAQAT